MEGRTGEVGEQLILVHLCEVGHGHHGRHCRLRWLAPRLIEVVGALGRQLRRRGGDHGLKGIAAAAAGLLRPAVGAVDVCAPRDDDAAARIVPRHAASLRSCAPHTHTLTRQGVAVGEAVVLGSAVHAALSDPLKESVRHAAMRAEAESAAGAKKPREPQITQTPFGMDVTEMMPLMQAASERQQGAAAAKKRRLEEAAAARARKTSSAAAKACKNLLEKKDEEKLSIADLVALIKWRGGP